MTRCWNCDCRMPGDEVDLCSDCRRLQNAEDAACREVVIVSRLVADALAREDAFSLHHHLAALPQVVRAHRDVADAFEGRRAPFGPPPAA